jgi:hypothetical protein
MASDRVESSDATTRVVGSKLATSRAKVGPEITATLGRHFSRTVSHRTSDVRRRVTFSSPLVALTNTMDSVRNGSIWW